MTPWLGETAQGTARRGPAGTSTEILVRRAKGGDREALGRLLDLDGEDAETTEALRALGKDVTGFAEAREEDYEGIRESMARAWSVPARTDAP